VFPSEQWWMCNEVRVRAGRDTVGSLGLSATPPPSPRSQVGRAREPGAEFPGFQGMMVTTDSRQLNKSESARGESDYLRGRSPNS